MGRAFNIGLVVSAQNFSLLSPALRNNTSTVICLSALGEDVQAMSLHMSLTPEQAEVLPRLRLGEAVVLARSEWPLAIKGFILEII